MKQFIDKLIERLEETSINDIQIIVSEVLLKYGFPKESVVQDEIWDELDGLSTSKQAIKIVNQLAEEHKDDIQTIDVSELLGEQGNDGWIPCSERLPEENQMVLTCDKDGWVSTHINMSYPGAKNDFECGYYTAWMPLPEPFKLKGQANE